MSDPEPQPESAQTGAVAGFRRAEAALEAMLADAEALAATRTSLTAAAGALTEAAQHLAGADVATRSDVSAVRDALTPLDGLPAALEKVAERIDAVAAERVLHRFDELEAERSRRTDLDAAEHRAGLERAVTRITTALEDQRPSLDLAAIGDRVGEEVTRGVAALRAEQQRLAAASAEALETTGRLAAGQEVLRRLLLAQALAMLVLAAIIAVLVLR